ncbi:MAG: lipopolysaccharide transport periplasmic protein LptA [Nitrospiraceae bacterium]|nr:MAG: lipopolysaccharide transport periplasmic protein LptA [Nitrospiraceae bacterium]
MSKQLFILHSIFIFLFIYATEASPLPVEKTGKQPVVITSQTLTADNRNNTAVFEGSVTAKTEDLTIHSDRMTVFYDNAEGNIKKIEASGNVKVVKKGRAIFSDEALYQDAEKKITFRGNPKVVEGENVISGSQIIFFLQDDRAVVEESRVILQNRQKVK